MRFKGSISIDVNQSQFLSVEFKDEIRIDIKDESILDLLGNDDKDKKLNFRSIFNDVREFAKYLTDKSLTAIISIKGKNVIILGKKARPSLSKIITKSDNIEFKNISHLGRFSLRVLG